MQLCNWDPADISTKLLSSAPTVIQEVEFGPDSPLEEAGFEPSVPRHTLKVFESD
jgi:hypothetical protein